MATVSLFPRLGATVLDEYGAPFPPGGAGCALPLADYYAQLVQRGELVTEDPSGLSTPVVQIQAGRVDNTIISITTYGAIGDGVTDATAAIQAAIDNGSSDVLIPAGTYLCGGLNLRSNIRLRGTGWGSVLLQKPGEAWMLSANSVTGGTPNPATNITNITIQDIQLRGRCDTLGFSEFVYLLNLNAVSNVLIEGVLFKGFQGDGFYLGSSNVAHVERHNEHVTVRKCYFDGINNQNRNGISVIDCTGFLCDDCDFVNTTVGAPLVYPGCIDFEPNADAFARIRNVTVTNCRMSGGNGAGVACLVLPQTYVTTPFGPFAFLNNTIRKPVGFSFFGDGTVSAAPPDNTADYNVTWENNNVTAGEQAFILSGVKGGRMLNNYFSDMNTYGEFGYTTGCTDLLVQGNTFQRLALTQTTGLVLRWCSRVKFLANCFVDIGNPAMTGGRAIGILAGVSTGVVWRDNSFASPLGYMTQLIGEIGGTLDNGRCEYEDNANPDNISIPIIVNKIETTAAPSGGTWNVGSIVYNKNPSSGAGIGWTVTNLGVWKPFGVVS